MIADDYLARQPLPDEPPPEGCRYCGGPDCPVGCPYCEGLTTSDKAALVERQRARVDEAHTIGLRLAGKREAYDEIVAMLAVLIKDASVRHSNDWEKGACFAVEAIRLVRP